MKGLSSIYRTVASYDLLLGYLSRQTPKTMGCVFFFNSRSTPTLWPHTYPSPITPYNHITWRRTFFGSVFLVSLGPGGGGGRRSSRVLGCLEERAGEEPLESPRVKQQREHEAETRQGEFGQRVDEDGAEKDVMKSQVGKEVAQSLTRAAPRRRPTWNERHKGS